MPQFDLGSLESYVKYKDGGVQLLRASAVLREALMTDNMPTLVKKVLWSL